MMDLEVFKEKLSAEKARLLGHKNSLVLEDGDKADMIDQAASDYSTMVTISISETERTTLRMIDDALQRIGNEEFGVCQHCENEIAEKRLEAIPWARLCINCQSRLEKGLD